jgi:flagellar protein FlgJ
MDPSVQSLTSANDFKGLAELRAQAQKDRAGSVDKVAQQFEGMFLHMMLKEMRKTVPESEFFDTPSIKLYQDMQDQQLAMELAKDSPLGIAGVLKANLEQQGYLGSSDPNNDGAVHANAQPGFDLASKKAEKNLKLLNDLQNFSLKQSAQTYMLQRPSSMAIGEYRAMMPN